MPPQSFFPEQLRQRVNLSQLLTLPAHGACNGSFKKDEEYFLNSVGPLAHKSRIGRVVIEGMKSRWRRGIAVPLGFKIVSEFESRPGGLYLPRNRVLKHVDRARADNVLLKIVRGLHWHHFGTFLSKPTVYTTEIVGPEDDLAECWQPVLAEDSQGIYRAVFDWKHRLYAVDEVGLPQFQVWGLLLWDNVLAFIAHHERSCTCGACKSALG